jgi:acyl carrier protein phosphodiesterase
VNYLAHAYLSFGHADILAGNMISDYVKGKKKFAFPAVIQKGIQLHRLIDTFTDEHPATKIAKEVFRPQYRLYSGAFIDVVYDHFLATDIGEFTDDSLFHFSQQTYSLLEQNARWMPDRFAAMFPYMKKQNWLYHYRTMQGTQQSFGGLVRRATYLTESAVAAQLFTQHYQLLQDQYRHFWTDMKPYAREQYQILCVNDNT